MGASRRWAPRLLRGFVRELARPMAQPRFRPNPAQWNPTVITASWLGHSSVLINFCGLTIMTDPVLAPRIGATFGRRTFGPKRLIASALTVAQLPPTDLILLSHAHMDHLHVATLRQFSARTRVITASGTGDLLRGTPMKDVRELEWGERTSVSTQHGEITVEAFEVRHWGARWRHDIHRGYNGYILERNNRKILFAGDTAYCESFKKLRPKGPFDLAIMPIGAYKCGPISSHCTPEEAVAMANDAGARYVLPIHHQTFNFGQEHVSEPIRRLCSALPLERIALKEVGETFTLE